MIDSFQQGMLNQCKRICTQKYFNENIHIAYYSCANCYEKMRSYKMSIKLLETQWFRPIDASSYMFVVTLIYLKGAL